MRMSRIRRAIVALSAVVLVAMTAPAAFALTAGPAGPSPGPAAQIGALLHRLAMGPRGSYCGWFADVSAQTLNVAAPDSNSNYWVQPYFLAQGQQLVIHGIYPASRYFSFTAYGANGLPINDTDLHDTQIVPDAGSVNPFTTPNPPTDPAQLQYSVRLVSSQPPFSTDNTLAGLPSGQSSGLGLLVYRLYLSTKPGDTKASVPLPSITTTAGKLPACTPRQQALYLRLLQPIAYALVAAGTPDPSTVTRGADLFRRFGNLAGLFPNPDTGFVAEATDWRPGTVVVIRGKAFTFPDTRHGGSVTEATQVRYWSMCSNVLANPYPVAGCAADDETAVNAQGYYLYAISMPQDRPKNATAANGVTWLPWATPRQSIRGVPPNVTYLRTMLPASGFNQAAQAAPVPAAGESAQQAAAAAAAAMGAYYPTGAVCTTTQFETKGPSSCFNSGGTIPPELRDYPYCEVIPDTVSDGIMTEHVFNTLPYGPCIPKQFAQITEQDIITAYNNAYPGNSTSATINGPRHWVLDSITSTGGTTSSGESLTVNGIEFGLAGQLVVPEGTPPIGSSPYVPSTIQRNTIYLFKKGTLVYELTDPSGTVYVMQSYSQQVDQSLTLSKLRFIGPNLQLPTGWRYTVHRLTANLTLTAAGSTTIVNDYYRDTYQIDPGALHATGRWARRKFPPGPPIRT